MTTNRRHGYPVTPRALRRGVAPWVSARGAWRRDLATAFDVPITDVIPTDAPNACRFCGGPAIPETTLTFGDVRLTLDTECQGVPDGFELDHPWIAEATFRWVVQTFNLDEARADDDGMPA